MLWKFDGDAAQSAMNFVSLCKKEFSEIRTILPCDTDNQRPRLHIPSEG
jgi:hypothetical protein